MPFFSIYTKTPKKITWLLNALVLIWSFIALGEQEMYNMFPSLSQSPLFLSKSFQRQEKTVIQCCLLVVEGRRFLDDVGEVG